MAINLKRVAADGHDQSKVLSLHLIRLMGGLTLEGSTAFLIKPTTHLIDVIHDEAG